MDASGDAPQTLLKDRKRLPGTFPHASGCSWFRAAVSTSLHHFTPVRRQWGRGGAADSLEKLEKTFLRGFIAPSLRAQHKLFALADVHRGRYA